MTTPLRVLVCGTNFGRFYVQAVADLAPDLVLTGILSRGGQASRTLARQYGVAHHDSLDSVGDDIDVACVAVGSTISGGVGTDLSQALLARGVHVLQEHPVHHNELVASLQTARRHNVQYQVNAHYRHVEPVARFIAAAARLRARQRPVFVDAATPVHVLYPFVDILGRALGGLRPWRIDDAVTGGPLRAVTGQLAGVPLTLRVHHQLDPADRDNHALLWHRISVGTEAGTLTLADTHGPVLWTPTLHVSRDADHRLVFAGDRLGRPSTALLPGTAAGTQQDIFDRLWPQAVRRALREFAAAIHRGDDPLRTAQFDITACRIWSDLAVRLGPPEVVRPAAPETITIADLADSSDQAVRAPAGTGSTEPYSPTAEFFDLAAAPHVAEGSAPAVVAALSGIDAAVGPVVEIGAGTGLVTEAIARAHPDLEILAYEPATGMRAVLTSRIYRDPDLRRRVTVSAEAAPEIELPDVIAAAVVCGVAGHLATEDRVRLWRRLAERLAPNGRIVVELMAIDRPVILAPTRLARADLGRQSYEWWFSGEPDGADRMRLHTTWRVSRGDTQIRDVTDQYHWHTVTLAQIAAEARMELRDVPQSPTEGPPIGVLVPAARTEQEEGEHR
ncbi:Gfo/Idh/MocA family oxidoreductase [Polymorphospora sp. NPDC051019]|uniref:Gfo/Idh/MocA family oxidoreductase n=1 Tax=Polymorphospora sp. NPDC051019 TaxID=3155725 RepID=UPI00342A4211